MHMRFECAKRTDKEEVLALYALCRQCEGCTWADDYPGETQFETDMACRALYVLRKDGCIVAAMSAGFPNDIRQYAMWSDCENPCELARVAVHPDHQGEGFGSLLLKLVMAARRGKGHDCMQLLVSRENPSARRLYERNGFVYRGFAKRYQQNWLCMERKFEKTARKRISYAL